MTDSSQEIRLERWEDLAEITALYAESPRDVRAYIKLRWAAFKQFGRLVDFLPKEGPVLDLACGYGLSAFLLALRNPERKIFGVDLAQKRVDEATRIARRDSRLANVSAQVCDLRDLDRLKALCARKTPETGGKWAGILMADLLYYLPTQDKKKILKTCRKWTAPSGVFVLKDFDHRPAAKYAGLYAQEMAVNAAKRLRNGPAYRPFFDGGLHIPTRRGAEELLEEAGFSTKTVPMHRGTSHPHIAFICR